MLHSLSIDAGFFRDVGASLDLVAWHAKQLQVGFAMLSAVDQCDDVVIGR